MKRYRFYIRKPGSIVWNYVDTYEGAALTAVAMRLARFQGCTVKVLDSAKHVETLTQHLLEIEAAQMALEVQP